MKPPKKTVRRAIMCRNYRMNTILNHHDFILKDDPLVPIKPCTACGHDKGLIVYTYKRWSEKSKKLSHFGMIVCDRCGSGLRWIDKIGRQLLIKKHGLYL